jgi:hypothetical protein
MQTVEEQQRDLWDPLKPLSPEQQFLYMVLIWPALVRELA